VFRLTQPEEAINVECPVCSNTFTHIKELENHLNMMAQTDEKHRVFYTLYRSMNIHYSARVTKLFADYIKKVGDAEESLRSIRGYKVESLRKLLYALQEELNAIEADHTDSVSESIYRATVLFIRSLFENPVSSKRDAMRIVSRLKKVFKFGTPESFCVIIKATSILSQKLAGI